MDARDSRLGDARGGLLWVIVVLSITIIALANAPWLVTRLTSQLPQWAWRIDGVSVEALAPIGDGYVVITLAGFALLAVLLYLIRPGYRLAAVGLIAFAGAAAAGIAAFDLIHYSGRVVEVVTVDGTQTTFAYSISSSLWMTVVAATVLGLAGAALGYLDWRHMPPREHESIRNALAHTARWLLKPQSARLDGFRAGAALALAAICAPVVVILAFMPWLEVASRGVVTRRIDGIWVDGLTGGDGYLVAWLATVAAVATWVFVAFPLLRVIAASLISIAGLTVAGIAVHDIAYGWHRELTANVLPGPDVTVDAAPALWGTLVAGLTMGVAGMSLLPKRSPKTDQHVEGNHAEESEAWA